MIDGYRYVEKVKELFSFLIIEFDFKFERQKINGQFFYDVEYKNFDKKISISYENAEDYFLVLIFKIANGNTSHIDNVEDTLHLHLIKGKILPFIDKKEIEDNNRYFSKFTAIGKEEQMLLKSARELRVCLSHIN